MEPPLIKVVGLGTVSTYHDSSLFICSQVFGKRGLSTSKVSESVTVMSDSSHFISLDHRYRNWVSIDETMHLVVLLVPLLLPLPTLLRSAHRPPIVQRLRCPSDMHMRAHGRAAAAKRNKRPPSVRRKGALPSFGGRLQRARSVDSTLNLLSEAADDVDVVAAFRHLALLWPRSLSTAEVAGLCGDERLKAAIIRLSSSRKLGMRDRCDLAWSFGMIFASPDQATTRLAAQLVTPLETARGETIEPTAAVSAMWGCETLGVPVPVPIARRAALVPFRLHPGLVASALDGRARDAHGEPGTAPPAQSSPRAGMSELLAQVPFGRDVISSGSAQPSAEAVLEDRGTCWLSDSALGFDYSGKSMAPVGQLRGAVAACRDAVRDGIGHHYCSVLLNHYPDGGSGMRFHADPGQGETEGWGYSTAVVSVGATRLFTFRRRQDASMRVTFAVRHGDVLHMHSDCQEEWQHAVVREQPGRGSPGTPASPAARPAAKVDLAAVSQQSPPELARISLVFKRSWRLERALAEHEPPLMFADAHRCLRAALSSARWPSTGAARARVLRGCGVRGVGGGGTFVLCRPGAPRPTRANGLFPELSRAVFALEAAIAPAGRSMSQMCAVSVHAEFTPHALPPTRDGVAAMIVSVGGASGGHVMLGGDAAPTDVRYAPMLLHDEQDEGRAMWSLPPSSALGGGDGADGEGGAGGAGGAGGGGAVGEGVDGDGVDGDGVDNNGAHGEGGDGDLDLIAEMASPTFQLIFFTPAAPPDADVLARTLSPPLGYRRRSTDELVLRELLGPRPAYRGPPSGDPRWDWRRFGADAFNPHGHSVLDIGAHIGVFTRLALEAGAVRVRAVEPEPHNAALWRQNMEHVGKESDAGSKPGGPQQRVRQSAHLVEAAVVMPTAEAGRLQSDGGGGTATLVLGQTRSDGFVNTWRHALKGQSHYKAAEAEEVEVRTVTLFGAGGLLETDGPWSYVKLDCEGCELALLTGFEPGAWHGVQRLVFEWSFTKQRRMDVFTRAVRRLEDEGFDVWYEGRGNWEQSFEEWPWPCDALVFAARATGKRPTRLS